MGSGAKSPTSASAAASLVKAENARSSRTSLAAPAAPKHETVEPVSLGWVGADAGGVDENELERRQRAIGARLAARQKQLVRDSAELERVRGELTALEAPLKAEIMSLRAALEGAGKREKLLVEEINDMRDALHLKEKEVVVVRAEKRQFADSLIGVMADYEKRKTEALNGIASLVGEDEMPLDGLDSSPMVKEKAGFLGF